MGSRRINESLVRASLVLTLTTGLLAPPALGCAHIDPSQASHHAMIAEASTRVGDGVQASHSDYAAGVDGVVDLSEAPTVTEEAEEAKADPHRFAPGPMSAATQIESWDADDPSPRLQIDLRNACGLELEYGFAPSDDPGDAHERRALEGYTIQGQELPEGHWLHLWDGGRWLGAAVTTVDGGVMEIAPTCDTLEVRFDLPERGTTSFAIHWELDADVPDLAPDAAPAPAELSVDAGEAPERWGAGADGRVELRLANLCAEPADYAFTDGLDEAPVERSTIAGHSARTVEVPAGWWLRYQILDDTWRGGATTTHAGAVIWLAPNCIDYGVGDGDVVRR